MREFDVIVLGTGAAGLTAAIMAADGGASVGVFEKSDLLGGTTAWSGGQVWIPNNPHMAELGADDDSREKALTYIMSLSHGMIEQKLAEQYVDTGPAMVRYLEAHTPVEFYAVGMPDYHPEFPGGNQKGGRTIECPIYPFDELGDWAQRVTPSPYYISGNITMSETPLGAGLPRPPSAAELARRAIRNERGCGQALIGRLLKGCLDRGVEIFTSHRAVELVMRDGGVAGVRFETPEGAPEVAARRGVVLATGGFERNPDYVRAFLRGPMTHPVSVMTNTGDGLTMAMKAGAQLANMREAWWMPAATVPLEESATGVQMISSARTLPRSIMINRAGKRFTNEAANYNAFGSAFHVVDVASFSYANLPCWLLFDQGYVDKYGFGGRFGTPGRVSDWPVRGASLAELAGKLEIPAAALEETVARWNAMVDAGTDADFHRGESAHDRWWGDPFRKGTKDGTLGRLDQGPFYAAQVFSGALGTKGGPRTDEHARVLGLDGAPIPGLYAAGNVMASPFGMTYGGPGGTLGPAMVFGYLAGQHAAQQRRNI